MARTRLNALEILKQLPRTNCRQCGLPTCLSFASLVAQGEREPEACPFLDAEARVHARELAEVGAAPEGDAFDAVDPLRRRVQEADFAQLAPLLGARLVDGDLVLHCLGREFRLSRSGRLVSQCHANLWVLVPLLDHIAHVADALEAGIASARLVPRGEWIKAEHVRGFVSRSGFFERRCAGALGQMFEQDLELTQDLLGLFGGRDVDAGFDATVELRLVPLPRVPLLVCHWPAEPPFEAKTGVYCDRATDDLLGPEALTVLGIGIAEMLKRFVARARFDGAPLGPARLG